jgi:hypothetical protein
MFEIGANLTINATCLDYQNAHPDWFPCNVTTPLPVTAKGTWMSPMDTPRLPTRPDPPSMPNPETDRPPSKDCTDMSFTHPDWTIPRFIYRQAIMDDSTTLVTINFNITSRVTEVEARCHLHSGHSSSMVIMDCSTTIPPPSQDPFQSQSLFKVAFNVQSNNLTIRHAWTCGDSTGSHSYDHLLLSTWFTNTDMLPYYNLLSEPVSLHQDTVSYL